MTRAPRPAAQPVDILIDDQPHLARIARVRARLNHCDAALITSLSNIRYLTGFTGSAGLLVIGPQGEHLIVDGRYTEQAAKETRIAVTRREGPLEAALESYLLGGRRCAVEASHVTLETMERLRRAGDPHGVAWTPLTGLVEHVRQVKDEEEIGKLKAAAALIEELLSRTIELLRPEVKEIEIAVEYERMARLATGRPLPFQPIVASGWRAAMPHGAAAEKEIRPGEFVVLDFGLELDGYNADITRTVAVGDADERMRAVYDAVRRANETAAAGIRPGMSGEAAHALAAAVLEECELAEYFSHGLGHGIGIEIHEEPRLSPRVEEELQPGMCFTIEPGAYITGWGGVRIEDAGVLRASGVEVFNRLSHDLIVV